MPRHVAFKSFLLLGAVLLTTIAVHSVPADPVTIRERPDEPLDRPRIPDQIILKFKGNATNSEKNQIRSQLKGAKLRDFNRIKAELRTLEDLSVDEAISRYKNHPKVEYIEPNYVIRANEIPNDPLFNQLYGLHNTGQTGGTAGADISATNAWDVFTGSDQVLVGVIDTGVDYLHPDLAGNIFINPGEIANNGIDDDNNGFIDDVRGWDFANNDNDPMDDNSHGSHVSGTIGAIGNNGVGVVGVNWRIKILPIKFLNAGGGGSTAGAIASVEYATMMGVHFTSNSWGGGGFSQALMDAIADAGANGQLFIAAAGNAANNNDVTPHYPSSYDLDNIVAVAATDHNDQLAGFSSFGLVSVDLAAPGVNTLSTVPGGGYGTKSGTSMATPHVAGVFGLVFGRFPAIGHLDARNLVLNSADVLPQLSGLVQTGARLNAFFAIADPDSIDPGPITDLAVTASGSNWLDLVWTATGDDDNTGTASRYIVKVSTTVITEHNFDASITVPQPPDPAAPGTSESMRVDNLDFSTPYFVAARVLDEFGNASAISNLATGTTLGPPDADVDPTSLSLTLLTGAAGSQSLTLSNIGEGTLDFQIPLPELTTSPTAQAAYLEELSKGATDPRVGDPVVSGSGGPDGFGYRWVDSDDPGGPVFTWTDISGTGNIAISFGDDINTGPFPLGFTFSFYGVEFSQVRVCDNGFLSFTSTVAPYFNQPLPNSNAPHNLVAPFWDDLIVGAGDVYYQTDGTRFIVQWNNVEFYSGGGPYTFQAILYPSGTIEFKYLSMGTPDESATVGIQNAGGDDATLVAFNTAYVHDNMIVRIQSVPQWVTASPAGGTILAPGSMTVNVDYNATSLLGGTYEANVNIVSNDPNDPVLAVPVTLTVIGAPDIDVTPAFFDFGQVFIGAAPTTNILISNPGTDSLHVSSVSISDPAYTPDKSVFVVPPRQATLLEITFAPSAAALNPATLTLGSDDPDEPSVQVTLAGEGIAPPVIAVNPTSMSEALFTGETATQTLTLQNIGAADLQWNILPVNQGVATFTLTAPDPSLAPFDQEGPLSLPVSRTAPIQAQLADLTGVHILWDRSHGQFSSLSWSIILGDLILRGATVAENTDPISPAVLSTADVLWSLDSFTTWSTDEIDALRSWVQTGGGFLIESDQTTETMNTLLSALGVGIEFDPTSATPGPTTNVFPHDITNNVNTIRLSNPLARLKQPTLPAGLLFNDALDIPSAAFGLSGTGRVVVVNDEIFFNGIIGLDDNQLFGNQAVDWLIGPSFVSVSPAGGTIAGGASADIDVLFDAARLFGGLYTADLEIMNNDPVTPVVTVPVELNVTGAPDMDLSDTSFDYGDVFKGDTETMTLTVRNLGTDDLSVSDLSTDHGDYTVDTTSFLLSPGGAQDVVVVFAPTSTGPVAATLTIQSNDPDQPVVQVSLTGQGLDPPDIDVSPGSLTESLLTNETSSQTLTIQNLGLNDLVLSIDTKETGVLSVPPYNPPGGDPNLDTRQSTTGDPAPTQTGDNALEPQVLIIQDTSAWGLFMDDILQDNFGLTATVINSGDIATTDFSPFDLVITVGDENAAYYGILSAQVAKFEAFAQGGGIVQYQAATQGGVDVNIAGGVFVEYGNLENLNRVLLPGHPLAQGLPINLEGNSANHCTISNLPPNTDVVTETFDSNLPTTVVYELGMGHVIATGMTWEFLYPRNFNSGPMLLNAVSYSLSLIGPAWISPGVSQATIVPGASLQVPVNFDATGLFGGDYNADILITSNDPDEGLVVIPALLQVTGVPDVSLSANLLDYGGRFLGSSTDQILTVSNLGTQDLVVSNVGTDNGDYTVDAASFTVPPGGETDVTVTFTPGATGPSPGILTVASDDPDTPSATVTLVGVGLIPPIVGVTPGLLDEDLYSGDTSVQTLALANTGGSDLTFKIALESVGAGNGMSVADAVTSMIDRSGILVSEIQITGLDAVSGQTESYTLVDPGDVAGTAYSGAPTTDLEVAIAGGTSDFFLDDIRSTLVATNRFTSVTVINIISVTPTLAELQAFDAVMVFSSIQYQDPVAFGNILADYVDAGGGVVCNMFEVAVSAGFPQHRLQGRWETEEYHVVVRSAHQAGSQQTLGTVHVPGHPVMENVNSFDGGSSSYRPTTAAVTTGGTLVASWSDGNALVAVKQIGNTNRADLGFYPVSSNARGDLWQVGTDGDILMANALVWTGRGVSWLSVDVDSGVVAAGTSLDIQTTFDATNLTGGSYDASIIIESNDPVTPAVTVAAHLDVTDIPRISLSTQNLDFEDVFIGYPGDLVLTVSNVGTAVLNVQSVISGAPDFSSNLSTFNVNPGQGQDIAVRFDPLAPGYQATNLTFTSNDLNSPHDVSLTGTGLIPPVITASPDTVEGAGKPGFSTTTKTLSVCNDGGSDLSFSVDLFGKSSGAPGPPTAGPKVALHTKAHSVKAVLICRPFEQGGAMPTNVPCSQYDTEGDLGVSYDVYLTIANADSEGVTGLSCGIDYNSAPFQGVDVFTWNFCGTGLQFPSNTWPAPESGNRMTWNTCEASVIPPNGVHAIAGAFYVYAYGPDSFSVIENLPLLSGPELKIADCDNAEIDVPLSDAGSVRFSSGETEPGVNPCISTVSVYEGPGLSKGEADPRIGDPVIQGFGGPDGFGYRWKDSDEPGGPVFDWVDIVGVGTQMLIQGDDVNSGLKSIGFSFPFYGNSFNAFSVCTNGWISFTSTATDFGNDPLPSTGAPENLLAVFWDDLFFSSKKAYYHNDGTRLIVQFEAITLLGGTAPLTFQVILYPSGKIVYQYLDVGGFLGSATVGIQNGLQNDGLTVAFNTTYVHDNLAVEFNNAPAWLSVTPVSGVVAPGECLDLTLVMNATALSSGDHLAGVALSSNDPASPFVAKDVIFHVGTIATADFAVEPSTLNLGSQGQWISAFVELPVEHVPGDIVLSTVMLNDLVPADPSFFSIADFNSNGIPDATIKFDRAAVEAVLAEGDSVPVNVCGEIRDTIYFSGTDHIRVIRPQLLSPNGGETFLIGDFVDVAWDNPSGWVVTSASITYSADSGVTWSLVAENIVGESFLWQVPEPVSEGAMVRVYVYDDQGILGHDSSDGAFTVNNRVTGAENMLPTVYALYQNIPNPFYSSSRILFDLPEEARVSFKIFDVNGRVVRVLENGLLPAGRHEAIWDGRDLTGREVASGIYFYNVEAGKFAATKRMLLIK